MEILFFVAGGIVFAGGFFTCFFTNRKQEKPSGTIQIARPKPSLRNPLRTYDMRYDNYKSKEGLLQPVKPKFETGREVMVNGEKE
jgi:hypothetical protein